MSSEASDENVQVETPTTPRKWALVGVGLVAILFFFVDVLGALITHGGLFSVVSGIRAADAESWSVDIDSLGLWTPMSAALCVPVLAFSNWRRVDYSKHWSRIGVMISIIVGGMILAVTCGHTIIVGQMAARGYTRCEARDHETGTGKSSVWFDNFVLSPLDCPAAR